MNTPPPAEESRLIATAETLIAPLVKADRQRKFQVRLLGIVAVAVALVVGYLVYKSITHPTTTALKKEQAALQQVVAEQQASAYTSCVAGNKARLANKAIWDDFLSLAIDNPNAAAAKAALLQVGMENNLPPNEMNVLEALLNAQYTVTPGTKALVTQFETYIAQNEQAVNCVKLRHTTGS